MADNNTDYAFGEVRDTQGAIELTAIAHADVEAGIPMQIHAAGNDANMTVKAATGGVNVIGVTRFSAKAGKPVVMLIRGITRIKTEAAAAIGVGGAVGMLGGELSIGTAASSGREFCVNIGGTLADGDTGLFYVDTIAGLIGGRSGAS